MRPWRWRAPRAGRSARETPLGRGLELGGGVALTIVASVGLVGLLASFSRASWLAFGVGACVWVIQAGWGKLWAARRKGEEHGEPRSLAARLPVQLVIPLLFAVLFLFAYRDLVISRFVGLDTPIEARSLNDRRRDAELALELAAGHPWRGVGAGNYVPAVREVTLDSRPVHSVPLLVAAELGVLGAVLWVAVMVAGLWVAVTAATESRPAGALAESGEGASAAMESRSTALGIWLAMVVVGLFDVSLWVTTSWRAAILFAVLAVRVAGQETRRA